MFKIKTVFFLILALFLMGVPSRPVFAARDNTNDPSRHQCQGFGYGRDCHFNDSTNQGIHMFWHYTVVADSRVYLDWVNESNDIFYAYWGLGESAPSSTIFYENNNQNIDRQEWDVPAGSSFTLAFYNDEGSGSIQGRIHIIERKAHVMRVVDTDYTTSSANNSYTVTNSVAVDPSAKPTFIFLGKSPYGQDVDDDVDISAGSSTYRDDSHSTSNGGHFTPIQWYGNWNNSSSVQTHPINLTYNNYASSGYLRIAGYVVFERQPLNKTSVNTDMNNCLKQDGKAFVEVYAVNDSNVQATADASRNISMKTLSSPYSGWVGNRKAFIRLNNGTNSEPAPLKVACVPLNATKNGNVVSFDASWSANTYALYPNAPYVARAYFLQRDALPGLYYASTKGDNGVRLFHVKDWSYPNGGETVILQSGSESYFTGHRQVTAVGHDKDPNNQSQDFTDWAYQRDHYQHDSIEMSTRAGMYANEVWGPEEKDRDQLYHMDIYETGSGNTSFSFQAQYCPPDQWLMVAFKKNTATDDPYALMARQAPTILGCYQSTSDYSMKVDNFNNLMPGFSSGQGSVAFMTQLKSIVNNNVYKFNYRGNNKFTVTHAWFVPDDDPDYETPNIVVNVKQKTGTGLATALIKLPSVWADRELHYIGSELFSIIYNTDPADAAETPFVKFWWTPRDALQLEIKNPDTSGANPKGCNFAEKNTNSKNFEYNRNGACDYWGSGAAPTDVLYPDQEGWLRLAVTGPENYEADCAKADRPIIFFGKNTDAFKNATTVSALQSSADLLFTNTDYSLCDLLHYENPPKVVSMWPVFSLQTLLGKNMSLSTQIAVRVYRQGFLSNAGTISVSDFLKFNPSVTVTGGDVVGKVANKNVYGFGGNVTVNLATNPVFSTMTVTQAKLDIRDDQGNVLTKIPVTLNPGATNGTIQVPLPADFKTSATYQVCYSVRGMMPHKQETGLDQTGCAPISVGVSVKIASVIDMLLKITGIRQSDATERFVATERLRHMLRLDVFQEKVAHAASVLLK